MNTTRLRAAVAATALAAAITIAGAGQALAAEGPDPIDPAQGRGTLGQITGPLLCDPPESPFRQTQECEVDHDGDVETPTINPYTGTVDSPGLLGDQGAGALAPLGLDELL